MVVLNSSSGASYDTDQGGDTGGYAPLSPNSQKKRKALGIENMDPNADFSKLFQAKWGISYRDYKSGNYNKSASFPLKDYSTQVGQPNFNPSTGQNTGNTINTSQPSPNTIKTGTTENYPMMPYEQALSGLQNSGLSPASMKQSMGWLNQVYGRGKEMADASGVPSPGTQGEANSMINLTSSQTQEPYDTTNVDAWMQEDPLVQNWMQQVTEYYSPENQGASLMDTYNALFKKMGLGKLDRDIIDAQTIMEGTEDDIRNEVQEAGGFGTDSQVQALAIARNKVLEKNYNKLVALRESKTNQLNMMMGFMEKDRAYADNRFDKMMGYQEKMIDMRDRMKQNTMDLYKKYDATELMAIFRGHPEQISAYEKMMGLPAGGLSRLASSSSKKSGGGSSSGGTSGQYNEALDKYIRSELSKGRGIANITADEEFRRLYLGDSFSSIGTLSKSDQTKGVNYILNNGGDSEDIEKFKTDRVFQAWVMGQI